MRALLVSIAAPPKNDPESLQTGKYLKYLSQKVELDIITSKNPTLWMEKDETLVPYLKHVKQIVEVPIFEPKYLSIALNKFFRRFLLPDSRLTFHWRYMKAVKALTSKPDIIYSRAFPISSILMAQKLKKHYNVPWVLHLSDPWVESPLFDYKKSKYHIKKERECFANADIISFTSESTVELYKGKYPNFASKFRLFPNVYDAADIIKEKENKTNSKTKIVYTGSLTGSRSLKLFSEAINILKTDCPQALDTFEIIAAGNLDSENTKIVQEQSKHINHIGFLSSTKARELQHSADILVAIDFDFKNSADAMFFPSKILDYFITKKPILAITTLGSTTAKILDNFNHQVIAHSDVKNLVLFLKNLKTMKKEEMPVPEKYSAELNATRLKELFLSLCRK